MFGIILYLGATLAAAGVLSFLYIVTRPVHVRDEFKSWKAFGITFAFALVLPYVGFEIMTKKFGPTMFKTVEMGVAEAGIEGELKSYKVMFFDGKVATVYAKCQEQAAWGGMDHPVVRLKLQQLPGDKWKLQSYHVLVCDNMDRDQIVFPPMW